MTMTKTVEYTYHQPVTSDVLSDVWYNVNYKTLYVQFQNGHYAGYADVPPGVVDALVQGKVGFGRPSVGRFYNSQIRGKYKGIDAPANMLFKRAATAPLVPQAAPTNTIASQPFVVRGEVKQTVESNYAATDLNDAIRQFLAENPGATVSEVTVKF